jgi:hypothetical protein
VQCSSDAVGAGQQCLLHRGHHAGGLEAPHGVAQGSEIGLLVHNCVIYTI